MLIRAKDITMLVSYQPADGSRQEWTFHPYEILSIESEPIEDVGGNTWRDYDEFLERLKSGNTKARRALLWVLLRRENPRLRFVDLVIRVDEVRLGADADDIAYARELLSNPNLTDAQRTEVEAQLAGLVDEVDEPGIVQPEGKGEPGDGPTDSP